MYCTIRSQDAVSLLANLLDVIVPPRNTDKLVRSLSLQEMQGLIHPATGMLPYHDPRVTALVWELKYYANPRAAALAGELLFEQLLAIAAEELGRPLLIPVPMHAARRRARGHNQTEVLCKSVLVHTGSTFEYAPKLLLRTVETRAQQGLERHKRLKNVHGSMRATDPTKATGRICVVVDDVTTTGATLEEARRALIKAGAARVHLVALAHS
jgi:ComF family protein